ncbi:MAG TPA: hypothetical protein VN238_19845 [Solirubrobacteraceae bacterium]|nr:hypothetical protein [Solirubrobacteraceae bacterium]
MLAMRLLGWKRKDRPPHISARAGVHKWGYSAVDDGIPRLMVAPPRPPDAGRSSVPPQWRTEHHR